MVDERLGTVHLSTNHWGMVTVCISHFYPFTILDDTHASPTPGTVLTQNLSHTENPISQSNIKSRDSEKPRYTPHCTPQLHIRHRDIIPVSPSSHYETHW
jgi:hypothetical protein